MQQRYHCGLSSKLSTSNSPSASIYQFKIASTMNTLKIGVITVSLSVSVFRESINMEQPTIPSPAMNRTMKASMSMKVQIRSLMQNDVLSNSLSQSNNFSQSAKTENEAITLCQLLQPLSCSQMFDRRIHAVDKYQKISRTLILFLKKSFKDFVVIDPLAFICQNFTQN